MPKNITRQNTSVGHIKKAAQSKSERSVHLALEGKAFVGRVDRNLGQYFQVSYYDKEKKQIHSDILASPCGTFSAKGKVRVRICVGDIVVLDGLQDIDALKKKGKPFVVEITGKFEGKDIATLIAEGGLPASMSLKDNEPDDVGIEFEREASQKEEEVNVDII
jgi:hypothetical protein